MKVYAFLIPFVGVFHAFLSSPYGERDTTMTEVNTNTTTDTSVVQLSASDSAAQRFSEHPTYGSSTRSTIANVPATHADGKIINWCYPDLSCGDLDNILCRPPLNDRECSVHKYKIQRLEHARLQVLAAINTFRDRLASGQVRQGWPTAANMKQLVPDGILEEQAAIWTLACMDEDNPCPVHLHFGHKIGQIHAKTKHWMEKDSAPVRNVRSIILEIHQAPFSIVDSYKAGKAYANFAQIAFAEARLIGCGMVRYLEPCIEPKCQSLNLVVVIIESLWCNVAPRLKAGSKLYKKGKPCSKCPKGTACNPNSTYKNLCAAPNDPANGLYIHLPVFSNEFQDLSRSPIQLAPVPALVFTTSLLMTLVSFLMRPMHHYLDGN